MVVRRLDNPKPSKTRMSTSQRRDLSEFFDESWATVPMMPLNGDVGRMMQIIARQGTAILANRDRRNCRTAYVPSTAVKPEQPNPPPHVLLGSYWSTVIRSQSHTPHAGMGFPHKQARECLCMNPLVPHHAHNLVRRRFCPGAETQQHNRVRPRLCPLRGGFPILLLHPPEVPGCHGRVGLPAAGDLANLAVLGRLGQRVMRGNFTSLAALRQRLLDFIDYFNRTFARPFRWTYTGRPVTAETVKRPARWRENWVKWSKNSESLLLAG